MDFFFNIGKKKRNAQIFKAKRNARGLLETNLFFFLALTGNIFQSFSRSSIVNNGRARQEEVGLSDGLHACFEILRQVKLWGSCTVSSRVIVAEILDLSLCWDIFP